MESSIPRESLESSANKFEELIRKSAKLLTDTNWKSAVDEFMHFLAHKSFLDRINSDSDTDSANKLGELIKSTKLVTDTNWISAVFEWMDILGHKSLLDWIDFSPDTLLESLSNLKSSCQNYLSQTRSDL